MSSLFNIFADLFYKVGFSPSTLSFVGLAFSLLSAYLYYTASFKLEKIYLAAFFLLVSGFFDAVDGALARKYKRVTRFGGVLDSTLDRIGEIMVYFGVIAGRLSSLEIGLIALSFSLMVSYSRARAEMEGLNLSGVGLVERPERLIILVLASFLNKIQAGMVIIALASVLTTIQRVFYAYKKLKGKV